MKQPAILLTGFLLCAILTNSTAQEESKFQKWEFSLSSGLLLKGPGKQMSTQMDEAGFGDDNYSFLDWLGSLGSNKPSIYPSHKNKLAGMVALKYNISQRHGIAGSINTKKSIVSGYNRSAGVVISVSPIVRTYSLCYIHTLPRERHSFIIGPSLADIRIEKANFHDQINRELKPGLNLGYSFKVINSKALFFTLGMNYTLIPEIQSGPYGNRYDPVMISAATVNPSSLDIQAGIGIRIGRKK